MTSPLPVMQYLVAFNNKAYDDPGLISAVASPAGALGPNNVWTDITARVRRHDIARGRQHVEGRFETGECRLSVDNRDGALNPWNTASPYAGATGVITQGVPLRVLANGSPRFTGHIYAAAVHWPDNFTSTVEIRAADAFRLFALANVAQLAPPAGIPYTAAVLADSPANWWPLSEAAGTPPNIAFDYGVATPNNGTYLGSGTQGVTGGIADGSGIASESLAAGAAVNTWVNAGNTNVQNADAASGKPANGFVLSSYAPGTMAAVYSAGVNNAVGGQTVGTVWLGSHGGYRSTAPGGGALVQILGSATSSSSINFNQQGATPGLLAYNAITSGRVQLNNPQPPPPDANSFECWLNTTVTPGLPSFLYSMVHPSLGGVRYNPFISSNTIANGGGATLAPPSAFVGIWTIRDNVPTSARQMIGATVPVVDGNWHHVVLVATSMSGAAWQLYVDGVRILPLSFISADAVTETGAPSLAVIAGQGNSSSTSVNSFRGSVQQVALYNHALTSTQVAAHFTAAQVPSATYPVDFSGNRIKGVLSSLGWPPAAMNIAAGDIAVQQLTVNNPPTRALAHLQLCELTEDGALFVDAAGVVQYVNHNALTTAPYTTSQATFGDNPAVSTQLHYQPGTEVAADDLDLWNQAAVGNLGQAIQYASDSTSVAKYGGRTFPGTTNLIGTSTVVAAARAAALVTRYKDPIPRVRRIDIAPLDHATDLIPEVIDRELLDCITVKRTGGPGGPADPVHPGTELSIKANVEKITDSMQVDGGTPGEFWTVTYGVATAFGT